MIKLQFITHHTAKYSYLDSARMALAGGCKWIQLRIKNSPDDVVISIGKKVKDFCLNYGATLILDDYVHLVKLIGADGVHLGKNDMPITEARALLGDKFIIGGTANTFDDVLRLYNDGVNYIGCGPFQFTQTKSHLSPILGINGYTDIITQMKKHEIKLPVFAIGGIERSDIPAILSTGVDGIALSGSVLRANNPIEEMKELLKL